MVNIMEVYIAKANAPESEAHANLTLPATPFELFDALDQARVRQGDELYFEVSDYYAFEYMAPYIADADNILELNALCQKLSELSDRQSAAFEGLLKIEVSKQDGPITLGKLIDLAYSADCCHVVDEALNDSQLGRFYAENGFVPDVDGLSDRLFDLLDFERIGRELRQGEGGVFTSHGYVVQHSDLNEVSKDMAVRMRTPQYQILLDVSKGGFNALGRDREQSVRLHLPADEAALDAVLTALDADSWDELGYRCVDCRVPSLTDAITSAGDVFAVNAFAEMLQNMGDNAVLKYKAALAAVGCGDLDSALLLKEHLDEYVFTPNISGPVEIALDEMKLMMSEDAVALLRNHVNLHSYGSALMAQDKACLTPYGLLEREDGQPIQTPVEEIKQSGMEMT